MVKNYSAVTFKRRAFCLVAHYLINTVTCEIRCCHFPAKCSLHPLKHSKLHIVIPYFDYLLVHCSCCKAWLCGSAAQCYGCFLADEPLFCLPVNCRIAGKIALELFLLGTLTIGACPSLRCLTLHPSRLASYFPCEGMAEVAIRMTTTVVTIHARSPIIRRLVPSPETMTRLLVLSHFLLHQMLFDPLLLPSFLPCLTICYPLFKPY